MQWLASALAIPLLAAVALAAPGDGSADLGALLETIGSTMAISEALPQ